MQRAAKRSRGFDEALQELRSENIGSPGGSQDHWDALKDLKSDMAEAQKSISRLHKQMAEIWEALQNEQARRIESVDELRKMLVELGPSGDPEVSPVSSPDGSRSPRSVLGQVIDLTVDDEDEPVEQDACPECGEPWEEAYPAPESQYEEF